MKQLGGLRRKRDRIADLPTDLRIREWPRENSVLDVMYTRERSFWLNVRILFWTAAAVVMRRQVAVHRDSGKMNLRKR